MGRNLFIRVCAATYDEDLMWKEWPSLCALVWPVAERGSTQAASREAGGRRPKGIMELAASLPDRIDYGELPQGWRERLLPQAAGLRDSFAFLEDALGERDVLGASKAAGRLEQALDTLESALILCERM